MNLTDTIVVLLIIVVFLLIMTGNISFNTNENMINSTRDVIVAPQSEDHEILSYYHTFPDKTAQMIDVVHDDIDYDQVDYFKLFYNSSEDPVNNVELHIIHSGVLKLYMDCDRTSETSCNFLHPLVAKSVSNQSNGYSYSIYENIILPSGYNVFKLTTIGNCNSVESGIMASAMKSNELLFHTDNSWIYVPTKKCDVLENDTVHMLEKTKLVTHKDSCSADYNSLMTNLLMSGLQHVHWIGNTASQNVKQIWGNSVFPDNNSGWIYGTLDDKKYNWKNIPSGIVNYYKLYIHDGDALDCNLYCIADNYADVYINNNLAECSNWKKIGSVTGGWNKSKISNVPKLRFMIQPGFNLFKFAVVNFGKPNTTNPSSLNVSCMTNDKKVLFHTDPSWACNIPPPFQIPLFLRNSKLQKIHFIAPYGSDKIVNGSNCALSPAQLWGKNANFKDTKALWMSSSANYCNVQPSIIDYFFSYVNFTGTIVTGSLHVIADDHVKIYNNQNDDSLSDNCNEWKLIAHDTISSKKYNQFPVTIPIGYNLFKFSVQVAGNKPKSSGLIVSMMDKNNEVIFNSSSMGWHCVERSYKDYNC